MKIKFIKAILLLITTMFIFTSCSSFFSDEVKAKSKAETTEKTGDNSDDKDTDSETSDEMAITLTFPSFTDTEDEISTGTTTVIQGTPVLLSVPDNYISYQWWVDSVLISNATSNTYTWDTSDVDKGVHTIMCVVKDSRGKIYSATVTITVKGRIQLL